MIKKGFSDIGIVYFLQKSNLVIYLIRRNDVRVVWIQSNINECIIKWINLL